MTLAQQCSKMSSFGAFLYQGCNLWCFCLYSFVQWLCKAHWTISACLSKTSLKEFLLRLRLLNRMYAEFKVKDKFYKVLSLACRKEIRAFRRMNQGFLWCIGIPIYLIKLYQQTCIIFSHLIDSIINTVQVKNIAIIFAFLLLFFAKKYASHNYC